MQFDNLDVSGSYADMRPSRPIVNNEGWIGHPLDPIGCLFSTLLDACVVTSDSHKTTTERGKLKLFYSKQNVSFLLHYHRNAETLLWYNEVNGLSPVENKSYFMPYLWSTVGTENINFVDFFGGTVQHRGHFVWKKELNSCMQYFYQESCSIFFL